MSHRPMISLIGADDSIPVTALKDLGQDGDVEFGVLLSRRLAGSPRFASPGKFRRMRDAGLQVAVHICGSLASEVIERGECGLEPYLDGVSRVQINTDLQTPHEDIQNWVNELADLHGSPIEAILTEAPQLASQMGDARINWITRTPPRLVDGSMTVYELSAEEAGAAGAPALPGYFRVTLDLPDNLRDAAGHLSLSKCRLLLERLRFGLH